MRTSRMLILCGALVAGCHRGSPDSGSETDTGTGTAPPPGEGIAALYPGDVGIVADPRVVFADDVESYGTATDLSSKWDAVYHEVRIATEPDFVHAGGQSVEFTLPAQDVELMNTVANTLTTTYDTLYLRYYSKFDTTFDITGSSHNGGELSAGYYVDGNASPGIPADGTNKYLMAYEDWRGETTDASPGQQNVYVYHPEQRSEYGDHFFPDGSVSPYSPDAFDFGPDFVPRPAVTPELGRWIEYEVMLHANTPGQRDGRITCWMDGEIVADFGNLRFRDVDTLKIDHFSLSLHGKVNPVETRKWYDDVVLATEYIGPRREP